MKYFLVLIATFFLLTDNYAQNTKLQNLQALKIAYVTKELNLSVEDAQKFWPVYNTYFSELKTARLEAKDDILGYEEKMVVIKRKYFAEFKRILGSEERARKVFLADRNFGNIVKKEIENRRKQREQ